MSQIKVNFQPKDNIDDYLNDDFNVSLYRYLTNDEYFKELYKPLVFFNLFFEQIEIIIHHKYQPAAIINHLNALGLSNGHLYYLLLFLTEYIYHMHQKHKYDRQLKYCMILIRNECNSLKAILFADNEIDDKKKVNIRPEKEIVKQEPVPKVIANTDEIKKLLKKNFNLEDFEADKLFENLTKGLDHYVNLKFVCGHNEFIEILKAIRKLGINRNDIARVFSKCVVFKNNSGINDRSYSFEYIRKKV